MQPPEGTGRSKELQLVDGLLQVQEHDVRRDVRRCDSSHARRLYARRF